MTGSTRGLASRILAACAAAGTMEAPAWGIAISSRAEAGAGVSLVRVLAALILCLIVAFFAILLIRQRGGRIDLKGFFQRAHFGSTSVEVVETRRLSPHADICLVRHDGAEYLLLLQAGRSHVLNAKLPPVDSGGTCAP